MRRTTRRVAALLGAVLVGVLPPAGTAQASPTLGLQAAGAAATQRLLDPALDPAERFASCLLSSEGGDDGDLILLFDQSGSIRTADPDNARVTAAQYLIDQLTAFSGATGTTLQVSVAGFDYTYRTLAPWQPLDPSSSPGLKNTVATLADDDQERGQETDYFSALDGARSALAAQEVARGGGTRCQAIAWFSDGELDIVPRTGDGSDRLGEGTTKPYSGDLQITDEAEAAQAEADARAGICQPGGVADQIRAKGVELFAIGLESSTSGDFGLMKSITDGSSPLPGGTGPCGNISTPVPGVFTPVADIDGLLFAFDAITDPDQQTRAGICAVTPCAEHRHTFVLDGSVQSARVLATSDRDAIDIYLTPPGGGAPVSLSERTLQAANVVQIGPVTVQYSWQSDRTVSFTLLQPADGTGWSGQWAVTFVNPAPGADGSGTSKTNIHISSDLTPALLDPTVPLYAGGTAEIGLGITRADGSVVDPTSIEGTATLGARLLPRTGDPIDLVQGLTKETIATPVSVDLGGVQVPGPGVLELTLAVTTKATVDAAGAPVEGTALTPRKVAIPVEVLPAPPPPPAETGSTIPPEPPAPAYPSVGADVSFGEFEGTGPVTADLAVTGPGCVWLPESTSPTLLGYPSTVGTVSLTAAATSQADCLRIDDQSSAPLALTLSTAAVGSGTITGSFVVMIAPVGGDGAPVEVPVTMTAFMTKPLNTTNFVLTLIVALILGPGIPLLLLYGAKWWSARIPRRPLTAMTVPIEVSAGAVLRDGATFERRPGDLRDLVRPDKGGRLLVVDGVTLRTRAGLMPTQPGFVAATMAGMVGAGSDRPPSTGKGKLVARLPLAVHNQWAVFADATGPRERAVVLILVSADATDAIRDSLIGRMRQDLPSVLDDLRNRADERSPAAAGDPVPASDTTDVFGGAAGSPPGVFGGDTPSGGWSFGGSTAESARPGPGAPEPRRSEPDRSTPAPTAPSTPAPTPTPPRPSTAAPPTTGTFGDSPFGTFGADDDDRGDWR